MTNGDNDRFGSRDDANVVRDEPRVGGAMHASIFHDAFPGKSQPIVFDAEDGLPRPDDERVKGSAEPLSHETLVCLGDEREWVEVFNDEPQGDEHPDAGRYVYRNGWEGDGVPVKRRSFSPERVEIRWGRPVVFVDSVEPWEQAGWVPVRPARPVCAHYSEQLVVADDIEGPGGKKVVPVHRFCNAYRTLSGAQWSIQDEAIYACLARSPRDLVSEEKLTARRKKKMQEGIDRVDTVLVPALGGGVAAKDALIERLLTARPKGLSYRVEPGPGVPDGAAGHLYLLSAGPDRGWMVSTELRVGTPHFLVLPDVDYQPADDVYEGVPLGWGCGMINEPNTGRAILRMRLTEPEYTSDDEAETWPAYDSRLLAVSVRRNAEACARALRDGKNVWIVSERPEAQAAFFAAVVLHFVSVFEAAESAGPFKGGLECLDDLSKRRAASPLDVPSDVPSDVVGTFGELATNFTHRVYLKNLRGSEVT